MNRKSTTRNIVGSLVGFTLTVIGASSASADVTYSYVGNDFTIVQAPYTTTDSVTGFITLSSALGAGLTLISVVPTMFSFSDGVQTINSASPDPAASIVPDIFKFSTNGSGQITAWDVEVATQTLTNNNFIDTMNALNVQDLGLFQTCNPLHVPFCENANTTSSSRPRRSI